MNNISSDNLGIICPICGEKIKIDGGAAKCPHGHSFDISKECYINMILPQKKHSVYPGDNNEMVNARALFLQSGYYEPLKELLSSYINCGDRVLDIGCGEGYYTAGMEKDGIVTAFDISKFAAKKAAKKLASSTVLVASSFCVPIEDNYFDIAINCFSPLCPEEILRVLKKGGKAILIGPGERHLYELKKLVYDTPYENQPLNASLAGFTLQKKESLDYKVILATNADIKNLFTMTPYYYKTSKDDLAKLNFAENLETTLSFSSYIFIKK